MKYSKTQVENMLEVAEKIAAERGFNSRSKKSQLRVHPAILFDYTPDSKERNSVKVKKPTRNKK